MERRNLTVLKFGSSVLRSAADLPAAVQEIYRELREGRRVLAVVSAFAGTTDRLRAEALERFDRPHPAALAALLASGEAVAAAFLALALDEAGVPAALLDPERLGLVTAGPLLDAEPIGCDAATVDAALAEHPVAVLPGFIARDRSGAVSLLGRGGSDLTAVYLAQRLGASRCRLLKDTGGLFTADPKAAAGPASGPLADPPRHFLEASWDDAAVVAGKLIQPKALSLAREHGVVVEIAAPGAAVSTRIGPGPALITARTPTDRPLAVVLLGLGTVGLAVYRRLAAAPELFDVVAVAARNRPRALALGVDPARLCPDLGQAIERPADVVVELIGGCSLAPAIALAALARGRHLVTANKEVIARRGPELEAAAREGGGEVRYAAAVGGAVPMLERVRALARERGIVRLSGVLNGTCNFVLDAIVAGASPAEAVRAAQERGFAEADPTLDLSGRDAAAKLSILIRTGFGSRLAPDRIPRRGIEDIDPHRVRSAAARGHVVRLVASAQRTASGAIAAEVRPVDLPAKHPLARTPGEHNRLVIECDGGGGEDLLGKGAGAGPTSLAVLADLHDLRRAGRGEEARHAS